MYYNRGECLAVRTAPLIDTDEVAEIVNRLKVVTRGCEVSLSHDLNGCGFQPDFLDKVKM